MEFPHAAGDLQNCSSTAELLQGLDDPVSHHLTRLCHSCLHFSNEQLACPGGKRAGNSRKPLCRRGRAEYVVRWLFLQRQHPDAGFLHIDDDQGARRQCGVVLTQGGDHDWADVLR